MRIVIAFLILVLLSPAVLANLPAGKIAVVEVTAIHGLADYDGEVTETFQTAFATDGRAWTLDAAVGDLDEIQVLLLVSERRERIAGNELRRQYRQQVRPLADTDFVITDLPTLELEYQLDMYKGRLALGGDGDYILCTGEENEPYHIWRIDGLHLVDRDDIVLD